MQTLEEAMSEVRIALFHAGMSRVCTKEGIHWEKQCSLDEASMPCPTEAGNDTSATTSYDLQVSGALGRLLEAYKTSEWFSVRYRASIALAPEIISESQLEKDMKGWVSALRERINDQSKGKEEVADYVLDACTLFKMAAKENHFSFQYLVAQLLDHENPEIRNQAFDFFFPPKKPSALQAAYGRAMPFLIRVGQAAYSIVR